MRLRTLWGRVLSSAASLQASIQKGSFVKLQPQTTDFIKISNPKAVLEQVRLLRHTTTRQPTAAVAPALCP